MGIDTGIAIEGSDEFQGRLCINKQYFFRKIMILSQKVRL